MRRKLAYSNPVLTNTMAKFGSLPQGDWHVSKTGGKLFVGDTNWKGYAYLNETDERSGIPFGRGHEHAGAGTGQDHLP